MEKILTVTIPAYNMEKYIRQTLDSFIEIEVLNSIEVIVVDDGSNDATAQIAEEYHRKYADTFYVISKENGGQGSAINKGIKAATGKYFKVVDGDDWVDTASFAKLVQYLKKTDSDVVLHNSYRANNNTGAVRPVDISCGFKYNRRYTFNEVYQKVQFGLGWSTIKTGILKDNNIKLIENSFHSDMEYIIFPVPFIKTIEYLDLYLYMYRIGRPQQATCIEEMRNHLPEHDMVLYRMVDFLNKYNVSPTAEKGKVDYLVRRIAKMYSAHIRILLSFPVNEFLLVKEISEAEEKMKNRCRDVYNAAGGDMDIKVLRKTNYRLAAILHFMLILYKMRRR